MRRISLSLALVVTCLLVLAARFAPRIVINYDGDAAGRTAAFRALPLCFEKGLENWNPIWARDPAAAKAAEASCRAALYAMLNCQSGMSAGVWQASRSRSATARRSAISCRLVLCSLSHPNLSQSCKLTFIAYQEDLRAGHDTRQEVVASSKFTTELLGAIDRGIHLAPEIALCFGEGRNDILQ